MTNTFRRPASASWIRRAVFGAALLAFSVTASAAYRDMFYKNMFAADDYIWLYVTSAQLGRGQEVVALVRPVEAALTTSGKAESAFKAELLLSYMNNYALPSVLYRLGAEVAKLRIPIAGSSSQYPAYLSKAMVYGFTVAFAVILTVAVGAVALSRNLTIAVAAALAITGMALGELYCRPAGQYLVSANDAGTVFLQAGRFLLNPSFNFSPFGFTPRSYFTLLVLSVFALRAAGRFGLAYALAAALAFVHQTYAGLLLGTVVSLDMVLRPQVLRSRAVWPAIVAGAALFAVRQQIWVVIGLPIPSLFLLGGASAVAVVALIALAATDLFTLPFGVVPERWRERNPAGSLAEDIAMLTALWFVSLPLAFWMTHTRAPHESLYFWSQLNGRWLGLIRPALMLALAYAIVSGAMHLSGSRRSIAAVLTLILSAVAARPAIEVGWKASGNLQPGLTTAFQELDRALVLPTSRYKTLGETGLYYAVAKALDTGEIQVEALLR